MASREATACNCFFERYSTEMTSPLTQEERELGERPVCFIFRGKEERVAGREVIASKCIYIYLYL